MQEDFRFTQLTAADPLAVTAEVPGTARTEMSRERRSPSCWPAPNPVVRQTPADQLG